jgi:beta-glucosidase
MRLGMFDPAEQQPLAKIGIDQNGTPEHRALALKVAQESIILLKNDGQLPLDRARYKRIAVIGPNADAARMQLGNYAGKSSTVTLLEGIRRIVGNGVEVVHEMGCPLAVKRDHSDLPPPEMANKAMEAAKGADLIIFVSGLDMNLEKEEGPARLDVYEGFSRGDRVKIELPAPQEDLIKQLAATGKPMVLVNCSGSAIAMPWETEHLPAVVQAWYPGEEGGTAVAQVLFGDVNPAGRLPITVYASTDDLPPFEDYSMANRTYRYFTGKPLYAFGYGLSYTRFDYADAKLISAGIGPADSIKLSFAVKNTGSWDGDEVAQVYFRHVDPAVPQPKLALCGFTRVHVAKGGSATVTMEVPAQRLRYWDTTQKKYGVENGSYELLIGGASNDIRLHLPLRVG